MTPENTSRLLHRLVGKLDELESQLTLDTDAAIDQFEAHRGALRNELQSLPESLHLLEEALADETHDLRQKLEELELHLALARMETVDDYRTQRDGIMKALSGLDSTILKIEESEDNQGLVHYKNFAKQARQLEDKLGALHLHIALETEKGGETLEDVRADLKEGIKEISRELKSTQTHMSGNFKTLSEKIRERSSIVWNCLKEFMQYIETAEQQREREEMEEKIID
ncbi:MAG: hypothetical protein P1U68_05675 [Verrucomicrobiales bacterium]|nr:hypothetical protein [Verrucomicrobiales bacterium]